MAIVWCSYWSSEVPTAMDVGQMACKRVIIAGEIVVKDSVGMYFFPADQNLFPIVSDFPDLDVMHRTNEFEAATEKSSAWGVAVAG